MSFYKYNEDGSIVRKRVVLDCSDDELITEQNHKDEVNINKIIQRHGIDLIQKTSVIQQLVFDDNPNNDFTEVMQMMVNAKDSFMSLPSEVRKQFDNDPAKFVDFVRNGDNQQQLIDMGLAVAPEEVKPVQVVVTNPETTPPPAE
jgi:hypothetical protein